MAVKIEISAEVLADIKQHEVKYTVIEEFAEPIKYFAEWAGRIDKLTARVRLADGTEGYLGSRSSVSYIVDEQYECIAKTCGKSKVMLYSQKFMKCRGRLFNLHSTCDKMVSKWRAENKECKKEYSRKWHAENKEYDRKWYAENKEYKKEYRKEFHQANPHIARTASQKRRLAKTGGYNELQFMAEFENSPSRTCWLSHHTTADGNDVHLEHMMPVSVDNQKPYGNSETNCYYLLGSLNNSKGNKNVFDWIDSMSQSHLQFLLEDYPVELSLQQFTEGMHRIITELAEKQGLTFEQYKEQYNRDYAEGLQEKAS